MGAFAPVEIVPGDLFVFGRHLAHRYGPFKTSSSRAASTRPTIEGLTARTRRLNVAQIQKRILTISVRCLGQATSLTMFAESIPGTCYEAVIKRYAFAAAFISAHSRCWYDCNDVVSKIAPSANEARTVWDNRRWMIPVIGYSNSIRGTKFCSVPFANANPELGCNWNRCLTDFRLGVEFGQSMNERRSN